MGQKGYEKLTDQEKGELLVGPGVFVFPHNDPDTAIDYSGLSGTITLNQYIDIVNNSTITLYFKLEATILSGDPSKWGNLTLEIGEMAPNEKYLFLWEPTREVPTSKITESLRLVLKAYTDEGYLNEYGSDYIDFNYEFLDHTLGQIVSFGDFEGTDPWSRTSGFGNATPDYAYTGAFSLECYKAATDNEVIDPSGQYIPNQTHYIYQTIDLSSFSSAYLVLHPTFRYKGGSGKSLSVIRIWTPTKDYIIRVPIGDNTFNPYRIAIPLPCVNAIIKITSLFSSDGATTYYTDIDTVIIVGFT